MTDIKELAKNARNAGFDVAIMDTKEKNEALNAIADILEANKDEIFKVNLQDVQKARDNGLSEALVDRLTFNDSRFNEMVGGVRKVALLDDPVGRVFDGRTLPNGLTLVKKASEPPRKKQALPDFRHKAAISTVTLGRDS